MTEVQFEFPKELTGDANGHIWILVEPAKYTCSKCGVKAYFSATNIMAIQAMSPGEAWRAELDQHHFNCDNCILQNVLE